MTGGTDKLRILVTGGSGAIGRQLIPLLLEKGYIVMNIDREAPLASTIYDHPALFQRGGELVKEWDELKEHIEWFNPTHIIHLAASFGRLREERELYEPIYHDDIQATHNVFSLIPYLTNLQHILFASSYLVYEFVDPELNPEKHFPYALEADKDMIYPRNLCGFAKLYVEGELEFLSRHYNKKVDIMRIYRVIGPHCRSIINTWCEKILKQDHLVGSSLDQHFDYVDCRDVAQVFVKAIETPPHRPEEQGIPWVRYLDIGSGKPTRIGDVFVYLTKELFKAKNYTILKGQVENERLYADIWRAKEELGYKPQYTWKQSIEDILESLK